MIDKAQTGKRAEIDPATGKEADEGLTPIFCEAENCNRFLGFAAIDQAIYFIKCPKCGTTNVKYELESRIGQDVHCPDCGRFLWAGALMRGTVKVKCPKCKKWVTRTAGEPVDALPLDKMREYALQSR